MPAWRYDGTQWVELTRYKRAVYGGWSRLRGWRWDGVEWVPIWSNFGNGGLEVGVAVWNLDEPFSELLTVFNLEKDYQT